MSEQGERAQAVGKIVTVVVFLAVAFAVIGLGIQFGWGGWAGLWALIAGAITAGEASSYAKKRVRA